MPRNRSVRATMHACVLRWSQTAVVDPRCVLKPKHKKGGGQYSVPKLFEYRGGKFDLDSKRLDWIRFGIEGFLLSIIGSAACACAYEMYAPMADAYNMLSLILMGIGVILLIVGIVGAAVTKSDNGSQ